MTREDLQALKKAADTIRRAGKDYEDALSWQDEGIARLARGAIASRAEACCSILSAARDIVEAHTASGHDLPARASDLVELLEEIGAPAWLDSFPKSKAEGWKADAAAIIAAARSAGSPARAKPAEKGAGTAQISTSTPATEPNTIRHLNTAKNEQELRRIFAALVEAGYIAGADAAGASMLQPFLDAFDPEAREQGRINWIRSKNGRGVDKAGICALLKLTLPNNFDTWKAAAAAIFGVEIGKHERERYWSHEDNEKRIDEIRDLMK